MAGFPNLRLIVPPWTSDSGVVAVDFGCDHQMQQRVLSNCYYEHWCDLCGYKFRVDTGD